MATPHHARGGDLQKVSATERPRAPGEAGAHHTGVESRRNVEKALAAAVIGLLVGLVAILVVVAASLQPPLRELKRIGDEEAQAVSVGTRIRDQLSNLRRRVAGAVRSPRTGVPLDTSGAFRSLTSTMSELLPLADTEAERAGVANLRAALDASAVVSRRIEDALRAGDLPRAHSDLARFLELSVQATQATDDIVQYNVEQVGLSAHRVHAGMIWALVAISILSVLVIAAALVLIRLARGAVARHATLLERHAAEMGAFAARTAHELRSPLQTLMLSFSLLRSGTSPRALDRAEAAAKRLRETIDDILQFSQSGAEPPADARAEVAGAVAEVLQDVEPSAAAAHVAINAEVPSGLLVKMTPGHLRIVVGNVVSNAVKYGAEVPNAHVDVAAHAAADAVDIVVRDTGPGIPPDAVTRMFEPYFRASTSPGGYGLGLATVKRLVDAYGGSVNVESAPGQGTTIAIHLPIANAGSGAPPTA